MAILPLVPFVSSWFSPEAEADGISKPTKRSVLMAQKTAAGMTPKVPNAPAEAPVVQQQKPAQSGWTPPTNTKPQEKRTSKNEKAEIEAIKNTFYVTPQKAALQNVPEAMKMLIPYYNELQKAQNQLVESSLNRFNMAKESPASIRSDLGASITPVLQTIDALQGTKFADRAPAFEHPMERAAKDISEQFKQAKTDVGNLSTVGKMVGGTESFQDKLLTSMALAQGAGVGGEKWKEITLGKYTDRAEKVMASVTKGLGQMNTALNVTIPSIYNADLNTIDVNALAASVEKLARVANDVKGTMTDGDIGRQIPAALQGLIDKWDIYFKGKGGKVTASDRPELVQYVNNISEALKAASDELRWTATAAQERVKQAASIASRVSSPVEFTAKMFESEPQLDSPSAVKAAAKAAAKPAVQKSGLKGKSLVGK